MTPEPVLLQHLGLARDTLAGQVAVVTGAGRGIGRATALALAWLGAKVVIAELGESGAEAAAAVQALGGDGCWLRTDVSDPDAVAALAAATRGRYGDATILVNNAIHCPVGPVLELALADWDRAMAVNLRGTFLTCKAFLPGMLAAGGGTIVNLISTDAMPGLAAYMATKAGIAAFSRSLAAEVGDSGVRVVALAPGFVDTPGLRAAAAGLAPRLGMTPEAFLLLSLHPAYAGAMPAADAGAAAAYLIARLAADYHGEQVTAYEVLERAGLLPAAGAPAGAATAGTTAAPAAGTPAEAATARAAARALAQVDALAAVLAETEGDFTRLPIFVRPLARGAFKQRTGQDTRQWREFAAGLRRQVEAAAAGDPGALRSARRHQAELLERLAAYYQAAPGETARFTKDEAVLGEVRRVMAQREQTVRALLQTLASLSA